MQDGNGNVRRHGRAAVRNTLLLLAALVLVRGAAAQYEVGVQALERGEYAEAWMTLHPLARQGHPRARHDIGIMHALGLGVPASMEEAARWLTLAADQGVTQSQARLGWMYFHGHGVPVDLARAAHWSRLAAEQGDPWAQSNYGYLLDRGMGVARDREQAAAWYRRSAQQGFPEAQRNLGSMHENGHGVARDLVTAFAWYGVAAAGGDGLAVRLRDAVARRLSAADLERGRERARELFQRHGSDPSLGG